MPAPKGNQHAAKPGIDKPLRARFADEKAIQTALDLSPAKRGEAMAKFEDLNVKLGQALSLIVTYAPKSDYIKSFIAECDELLG